MAQYIAELDKIRKGKTPYPPTDYKETFDTFCHSLLGTDLLGQYDKELVRGLLERWDSNKRRHNGKDAG